MFSFFNVKNILGIFLISVGVRAHNKNRFPPQALVTLNSDESRGLVFKLKNP